MTHWGASRWPWSRRKLFIYYINHIYISIHKMSRLHFSTSLFRLCTLFIFFSRLRKMWTWNSASVFHFCLIFIWAFFFTLIFHEHVNDYFTKLYITGLSKSNWKKIIIRNNWVHLTETVLLYFWQTIRLFTLFSFFRWFYRWEMCYSILSDI